MPILKNPHGLLVCVTPHMARYWLNALPEKRDYDGKITQRGYSVPADTEKAREEYIEDMKAAERKLADDQAKKLQQDEASAFSIAKGLLRHVGMGGEQKADKPKRGKSKKDED